MSDRKDGFEQHTCSSTSGRRSRAGVGLLACGAMTVLTTAYLAAQGQRQGANPPIMIQKQGSFAAGGTILGDPNGQSLHCDHGYVDYQIPVNPRRINLVMWHSAAAHAFLNRWDGGEGYQSIFLRRGFPVYIWDGPQIGRANWGCTEHAYKPGIARGMNDFMAQLCLNEPRVVGLATVFPGEPEAGQIVREAFALGLRGVKLHCHVQQFAPDDERLHEIYAACAEAGKPLVIHAGREPNSPAYGIDVSKLCAAERIDRVLNAHPKLKLCVPHLGADEFEAYADLLERHDRL